MIEVTALGELLIDFSAKSADVDGYPTMTAHAGGAPANFLAAARSFGHEAALIAKVGDDAFGRMLVRTLKNAGIRTEGILIDPDVFTTLAFVTLDSTGNRSFSFARKPGADTSLRFSEVKLPLIDEAEVFYYGTLSLTNEPSRSAAMASVSYAKAKGRILFCDPNLRLSLWKDPGEARSMMEWAVSRADIVKISDEECVFLWGCRPETSARRLVDSMGVKLAMVTLGPEGCLLVNRNASVYCKSPSVHPVDTTGAGDIFGGSALSRILEIGKPVEDLSESELFEIGTFASASASLSTEHAGGIASIQRRDVILNRIRK